MNRVPGAGSLRAGLIITLLALLVVVFLPLLILLPSRVRASEVEAATSQVIVAGEVVAGDLTVFIVGSDRDGVSRIAERGAQVIDADVVVTDAAGTVVGRAGRSEFALPPAPLSRASLGEATSEVVAKPTGGDDLVVAVPVLDGDKVVGALGIRKPLENAGRRSHEALWWLLGWSAATGVLAVALAHFYAAGIKGPVGALVDAAERVAAGELETGVAPAGPAEVRRLGRAFAAMTRALRATVTALSAERDRLDVVQRHMADGTLIVTADGVVTLMNPAAARILGLGPASVGRRLATVVREHEIVDLFQNCLADAEQGSEQAITVERATPRRYLRVVATRTGAEGASPVLLVVQDLTELRRLEGVRRDFLANVSHELRTPIAAIKAMVETLEDGALDDPPVARDFTARIHREVDGLAHLVEELLQLSRIESGQAGLRLETVYPRQLTERTVERLYSLAERVGVRLALDTSDDLPEVRVDKERIAQVLVNIVHNAIKFTPAGGTVTVSARRQEDSIVFTVADTGIGIETEDLPRVFERFYKADKARATGGTGLGLAIAKHLVQAHGGRIWAESDGPGLGSRFSFALPVSVA